LVEVLEAAVSLSKGLANLSLSSRLMMRCVIACSLLLSGPAIYGQSTATGAAAQDRFAPLDAILKNAVNAGLTPGAVCIVGHNGVFVYRKAFGNRALQPSIEPMTMDTIFDMGSLTKVMATTGR
jgi:CubicO group peptidase (beta-lactamase class C family)